MTTMPPEMSSTATANVVVPPTSVQRESMSSLHASRSRFMITDILAGSAAAAAAAIRNGSPPSSNSPTRAGGISAHLHLHQQQQHHHQLQQQQQQQQHAALQHYLAQQQHLLQQHQQQQQQQQHLYHSSSPPTAAATAAAQQHHHQHHHQQQHALQGSHSLHPQLPPAAAAHLIGFPAGAHNGLHAVQAAQAAHYAALQQERERLRDLDVAGSTAGLDGHDDRSRSPHPVIGVRDLSSAPTHGGPGGAGGAGGGGGGGGSSVSGDQASTIDDSDSDTCGAKDDDGNSSIKSDNLMGLSKKQRKARTAFTDHQLQTLEKSFERQKYLSVQDRMELANKLELSDCQVKTWYQNRRTKWKRQTAVGLELLAEAGNYAAFQRLYGGSPYLGAWPYAAAQSPHGAPPSAIDLYYRQAAAAAALQKPLSYRMYPSVPPMGGMGGMPVGAAAPMPHLTASNSLSSLSSYYQSNAPPLSQGLSSNNNNNLLVHSPVQSELSDKQRHSVELQRTPSPQLNPGSPPERAADNSSCPPLSDDDADAGDGYEEQQQLQQDAQDEEDAIEV